MKRIFTLYLSITVIGIFLLNLQARGQSPEQMSYQAVIRDAGGELVKSSEVAMRIQLLKGSEFGASAYVETHIASTNANGLLSLEIGMGTVVSGDFSSIDWADGPYFLKTETDPAGGTDYSITGTSQILSVPYALYAKTAETVENITYTETDPEFESSVAAGISGADTTNWHNKLETEADPVFESSVAAGIEDDDITSWNNKLDVETDPAYNSSVAAGITETDTTKWNNKLDTETDPEFNNSAAAGITETDKTTWNNKLDAEVDGSVTNEIQTISRAGTTVTLSNGGGTFKDSVNVYTAGAGIEIADKVISRTEPTPSAFNVLSVTFQSLAADVNTMIDFTYAGGGAGTFIENNVFSLDTDEYTVPEDGVYFFEALVTIDTRSNSPSNFYLYYSVNGSAGTYQRFYSLEDGGYTVMRLNMTLNLSGGDKVSLVAKPRTNATSTMGGNSYGVVRWSGFKVN